MERMVSKVQSDLNGNYILIYTAPGKYQVGIDPLSLPKDKYKMRKAARKKSKCCCKETA